MAVDIEALKAIGLSDDEIAQIANFDPSQLNMGLLGSIGGLGVGGGVYNGEYKVFDAPLSNKGNPTSQMGDNKIYIAPQSQVRLVNQATGETITQGVGYDAAQEAIDKAKSLTSSGGNKANWQIQVAAPGEGTFSIAANEKENKNVLGEIAGTLATGALGALVGGPVGLLAGPLAKAAGVDDEIMKYGLPIALSLTPLGPVAGSALGSALGTAYTGGDIGDILKSAAISGATAGTLKVTGADKFLGYALTKIPGVSEATQAVASNIANATGQSVANEAVKQAADEIVVSAIKSAAPNLLSGAVSGFTAPTLSNAIASSARPNLLDQIQTQTPGIDQLPEIIATANPLTMAVPAAVAAPVAEAVTQPTQATPQEQAPEAGPEIVATAPTGTQVPVVPPLIPDVAPLEKFTPTETLLKDVAMGPEQKSLLDRLTANMNLVDYLQLASLVGSAGAGLLGGGGGEGTAVPYVSPFGPGMGAGGMPTGPSRQLNPTIADYERYGFGPEALFFAPQSNVVAPTTTGPASAMVNPQYVPLI
jgi:hypothetical protein